MHHMQKNDIQAEPARRKTLLLLLIIVARCGRQKECWWFMGSGGLHQHAPAQVKGRRILEDLLARRSNIL